MPDNNGENGGTPDNGQNQNFEQMYKDSSAEGHKRYEQAKKIATMAVKADPTNLIELYAEDPDLAEKISQSEYDLSFDEAKKQIEGYSTGDENNNSQINEDDLVEKIYSKITSKEKQQVVKKTVTDFYKENKINGDFKKDFDKLYKDLSEGKNLDEVSARNILNIAFREAKQTSKHLDEYEKAQNNAKILGGAGQGSGGQPSKVVGKQILKGSDKPDSWY